MRRLLPCFCLILLFVACDTERRELRQALRAAGDNRPELEAVLDHYRSDADSLKLRAAKYLIRYMPLHRSYDAAIEAMYDRIDSMIPCYGDPDSLTAAIADEYLRVKSQIGTHFDIQTVSSDYLIRNIEQAFDLWRNKPWAGLLDFDEFCEYLLPYKCADMQPLTDWRTELAGLYNGELGKHPSELWRDNPRIAAKDVNKVLYKLKRSYTADPNPCPVFRATTITNLPKGTCTETSIATAQIMRSKGIPVGVDFIPNWATRPRSHCWMTVINHRHQDEVFTGYDTKGESYFADRPLPKVFRMTYRSNPEVERILAQDGWMPPSLPCLFSRDITEKYTKADTVECAIYDLPELGRTVYLAVFNNQDWIPVCWGKYRRGKARFEKIGRNIFYMPVVYDKQRVMHPAGDPFFLKSDGTMQFFRPDTLHRQTIRVTRKYGMYETINNANLSGSLMGGIVEAADNPQFRNARTVFELPVDTLVLAGTEPVELGDAFRYWRIRSTTTWWCDIAELLFFDGDRKLSPERIFADVTDEKSKARILMIDDGDLLTFAPMREPNIRIGFDFGRPADVSKILWFRRSDGNNVYPGYEYTLYAWNREKWETVGGRRAGNQTWLEFDDIPNDALLLLVCDTKGIENRPFTHHNGTIMWL